VPVFAVPKDKTAAIAVDTVKQSLTRNKRLEKVMLVCFDEENYGLYEGILNHDLRI